MAKVLRGGKWARGRSRSTSNAESERQPSRHGDDESRTNVDGQQSILCFVEERKHLGVASYDVSANEIHVSRVPSGVNYSDAATIVSSLEECSVVLPASYKDNHKLLAALHAAKSSASTSDHQLEVDEVPETREGSDGGPSRSSEDPAEDVSIFYLPNNEFGLGRSTEICSLITILGMPPDLLPDDRISFLSHVLEDDVCIMRAVGGLLSFIIQNGVFGSFTEDDDSIYLNAISHKNHANIMRVTSATLRALRVFSQDTHPVGRGSLRGKEGFSLFGIIKSHVKTAAARKLLRTWLHYPSTDLDMIQQRQYLVDVMKGSSNRPFLAAIRDALRGVKNVPGVLSRLKRICADVNDWKALYSSSKSFVALLETLKVAAQQNQSLLKSNLIANVTCVAESHLREAVSWMDAVIDFEESLLQGRMVVAPGFSEEIDELKRSYAALDDFLTKIGVEELNALSHRSGATDLTSLNATYEPQIGFLIALSEDECEKIGHDALEEQGLSFVFRSEEHRYFKNDRCKELDVTPGDLHGSICDLEAKAIRYLETKVFECGQSLLSMSHFVTELDCLQALASAASEYGWIRPSISSEGIDLDIEEGRHPLLELTVPSFIPNSTKMRSGDVHVVTGPNYSGKSVYLAQVALTFVLAQVGSFVPAKKARIGLVGGINSRISSFESVTFGQSSFFADAAQVAAMLTRAPERSLNLIDEFGKGTSEVDGMALLASTLRALLRTDGTKAPWTICATHFVEVLREPFLPLNNPRLGLYSMEVMNRNVVQPETVPRVPSALRPGPSLNGTESETREVSGQDSMPGVVGQGQAQDTGNTFSAVVRTYRLLPGSVCNESRALQCALEAGVPKSILERAANIHTAITKGTRIENAVASAANNLRIKALTRTVREFLATPFVASSSK